MHTCYVVSVLTTPFLGLLSNLGVCTTQLRSYAATFPEQHPEHYAERLGLMMIIVLGEAAAHGLNSAKTALHLGMVTPAASKQGILQIRWH